MINRKSKNCVVQQTATYASLLPMHQRLLIANISALVIVNVINRQPSQYTEPAIILWVNVTYG